MEIIPANQLKDGQVAIITNWIVKAYIGKLVMRSSDRLINLTSGSYWDSTAMSQSTSMVRLLGPSEEIRLYNKED